ncbi:hypothetical protein [Geminicoccus sp.]|uniref:hypothetical protein n=1 Tax=Geminicoccus sp. TaxID=2024832 RepID=UPI002E373162|nr:hypothetical protein [Geminicoccus sp.]
MSRIVDGQVERCMTASTNPFSIATTSSGANGAAIDVKPTMSKNRTLARRWLGRGRRDRRPGRATSSGTYPPNVLEVRSRFASAIARITARSAAR